jgi:hypothetical protein
MHTTPILLHATAAEVAGLLTILASPVDEKIIICHPSPDSILRARPICARGITALPIRGI